MQRTDLADWSARSESLQQLEAGRPESRPVRGRRLCETRASRRVQTVPATSMESLIENGTPSSGPSSAPPRAAALSARLARPRSAVDSSTSTTAFSARIHLAMRSKCASTSSARRDLAVRGLTEPARRPRVKDVRSWFLNEQMLVGRHIRQMLLRPAGPFDFDRRVELSFPSPKVSARSLAEQ